MAQRQEKPSALVIMPFDPTWSDRYELGIKAGSEAAGASCVRVDERIFLESITERIYTEIEAADLVIAELSERNPNVYYETGYAHGLEKPVILLTTGAEDIPFDLRSYPHVTYGSIKELRQRVEEQVRWCLENPRAAGVRRRRSAEDEELARMAKHIDNYLNAHGFRKVTFERIKKRHPSYTDEKLTRLIDLSPERYRPVVFSGDRAGIGWVD
jgi:hypothetical protein